MRHDGATAVAAVRAALDRQPRFALAELPTPLRDAGRLREALGGPSRCPRILLKRDDLTALGLGGNKARKLEFLLGDALVAGATTLVTTGATQSNHARLTAAAACRAGLRCELVLTARHMPPARAGNLLLDDLFGARVHLVEAIDPLLAVGDDAPVVERVVRDEAAAGRQAYVIPVGGSSAIGALGYVAGTCELVEQLDALEVQPSRVYYASGSRGTQAGLALGRHLCRAQYQLYGVAVSGGEAEKIERARRAANEAAARLGLPDTLSHDDLFTDQGFIGEGYAIPTAEGLEAIQLLARTEAVLLDPAYTSKAMAALLRHVRDGALRPDETVVFLHTGGAPALFTPDFAATYAAWEAGGRPATA